MPESPSVVDASYDAAPVAILLSAGAFFEVIVYFSRIPQHALIDAPEGAVANPLSEQPFSPR
ncbi:uncharacterized protein SCHCODRAFT_02629269, partial [Schizophyllum commune H4-8]|uniref:uncharacterized protein n=1 Tax=Schizophyllum commune (strain H4-8 / FGSC 9210) TaxID=578458 RepID=UPI00215F6326